MFGPNHPAIVNSVALARYDDFRADAERARLLASLPRSADFGSRMRRWLGGELVRAGEYVARGVPSEAAKPCGAAAV